MIDGTKRKLVIVHRNSIYKRPPVISVINHLTELGVIPMVLTAGINDYYKKDFQKKGITWRVVPFKLTKHFLINAINAFLWGMKARTVIRKIAKEENIILWIEGNYTFRALSSSFINEFPHILQIQELFDYRTFKGRQYQKVLSEIMPTSVANLVPEYNRAHILRALFSLKQTPYVMPNKPAFVINRNEMENLSEKFSTFLNVIGERKIILYQGILSAERNLINFIAAASKLNTSEFAIVLLGEESDLLQKYRKDYPNIIHIPYIPAPEYLFFTSIAYIGIVTYSPTSLNFIYCAPNKIFEYAAYGIPMVGNDVPGLNYTIGKSGCGVICNDNDINDIYRGIRYVIENHDEMSKQAYSFYNSVDNKLIIGEVLNKAIKDGTD